VSWREHLRPGIARLSALRPFDYEASTPDLARLDCNELAFGPSSEELARFAQTLSGLPLQRYPEMTGRPLREALAARWQVEPEEILLGNGSVEILGLLMTAFGAGTRREPPKVLYPAPSFAYYEVVALTHGVVPVTVPLDSEFQLDEARIAAAIDEARPALGLFASPNNPSGNRFPALALERLAKRMDAAFVVDEAYAEFSGETMLSRVRVVPGLFVLRSLSKIGLAGLRLGALVGEREAIAELDKVRLPWNVNSVTMALGCAALAQPELLAERVRSVVELRGDFERALRQIAGLAVYPSEANFILVRVPSDARAVAQQLLREGVLVKDVSAPGLLERCLRITVGIPSENARCVEVLSRALAPSLG